MADKLSLIGKPVARLDAYAKVTGQAKYAADIQLPGMLYARVLRSPYPHARIIKIDTSEAEALPGVKAIITHENASIVWSSGDRSENAKSKRYLFNNPVRFVGDPVAAVAAANRRIAEDALHLIKVEYELLPFVLEAEEALKPGAPEVRPGGNLLEGKPLLFERGDVEKGFAQADLIYEDTYVSKHINNAQLEPRASVAMWEGDHLTVWASTQGISNCRLDLARDLKIPLSNVRVICKFMGGGFGAKNQCHDFDLMAALLAKKTGRPVKLEYTRGEDFIGVHGRWPTVQHYKIGVKRDGTVTAIYTRAFSGMGAYAKGRGGLMGARELYRCPNVKTEIYRAYTNAPCSGNFRAPSGPQGIFGVESAMDQIAHELGIDPVEFRLKNHILMWDGATPLSSSGLAECIREGARQIGWREKWHRPGEKTIEGSRRHGIGMAIGQWHSGLGLSAGMVRINTDGSVQVFAGVTDIGTGAKTTMSLIAAEALGVPLEKVSIVSGDTDVTPYSVGESGSRTTTYTGTAIKAAAEEAKRQLLEIAAELLAARPEQLEIKEGKIFVKDAPERLVSFEKAAGKAPEAIYGKAVTNPHHEGVESAAYGAHFAEVEVDVETGQVKVINYVAAHDSGRIINRLTASSQIIGGVTMGMGMALAEELRLDPLTGKPLNPNYHGAKLMTHQDVPKIRPIIVEAIDPYGPYGAKALGEAPIVPSVAAIANAIFNATGARVKELPITPDKILQALKGKKV